ncbi:MAG: hypothetical protein ABH879_00115 [archaeon]
MRTNSAKSMMSASMLLSGGCPSGTNARPTGEGDGCRIQSPTGDGTGECGAPDEVLLCMTERRQIR